MIHATPTLELTMLAAHRSGIGTSIIASLVCGELNVSQSQKLSTPKIMIGWRLTVWTYNASAPLSGNSVTNARTSLELPGISALWRENSETCPIIGLLLAVCWWLKLDSLTSTCTMSASCNTARNFAKHSSCK